MSSPTRAPSRRSAWPRGTSPMICTQIVSGPRVVSPPTKSTRCLRASPMKPREKPASQPVGPRQRERERRPARLRAHRGHVREIHRERLVAEAFGIGAAKEMPAFDEHVGRYRELLSGPRLHERGVVADAELRPACGA